MIMKIRSIKAQLIVFLGSLALYLYFTGKDTVFLSGILIAVFFSVLTDSLFSYFKNRKFTVTESSVVTGLIVGYVLSGDSSWWLMALAGISAIASKHIIRFRGSHIFNPAAFGILFTVFLFGASTQWKAAYMWYALIPAGAYFAYRIRKLGLVVGYFAVSLLLYIPQAFLHNASILNILGYFNYFFILIMMVEPRTTPARYLPKMIFGAITAVFIFAFYEIWVLPEAELLALAAANLSGVLLERRKA